MKRTGFFQWLLMLALVVVNSPLVLAQRSGNIVEYFGKETVQHTDEGVILHQFGDGLLLKESIRPGLLLGAQDLVAWQMGAGVFQLPEAGQTIDSPWGSHNEPLIWEAIKTDTSNYFRGMVRGYLYCSYFADDEKTVLLDASGHTRVFINGQLHEGDHYDDGFTLIPFKLKIGLNTFLFSYGRFARLKARLVVPSQDILISKRDMTLPGLIEGEKEQVWAAIRIINTTHQPLNGYTLECSLSRGEKTSFPMDVVAAETVRKAKFKIPPIAKPRKAKAELAVVRLIDPKGKPVHSAEFSLWIQQANRHHERTFISGIDGSVQYYSVAPSTTHAPGQALVLSTHGASVQATNQTRAYKQKDWAYIVAPTNRRPFGFNWEEWGRIDALEVLSEARKRFQTETSATFLTGHSMGGHGSWYLGATYPDLFAAIAPAAGYADIAGYRRGAADSALALNPHYTMIERGASAGRVLKLRQNYLQSGIYVLHGDDDQVVPVEQARMMRKVLGEFHPNFSYYEYPGGSHWYGDHSMDWPPLFAFLKQNTIPCPSKVEKFSFATASPAISSVNNWISINQQHKDYELSAVKAEKSNDTIRLNTENVRSLSVLFPLMKLTTSPKVFIDGQELTGHQTMKLQYTNSNGSWLTEDQLYRGHKNPERYGGFKQAFHRNVLFVYATGGSAEENEAYYNKARFDAETFLYRGNSSVDILPDTLLQQHGHQNRNVIIYGNASNHAAWDYLLGNVPVRVENGRLLVGEQLFESTHLGSYFIYPKANCEVSCVGVVSATGKEGLHAMMPNDYFSGITGFPDLLVVDVAWLKDAANGVVISGFFGFDWSVENGDFHFSGTQK